MHSLSPCSSYVMSIVLIGVGDGPWEELTKFDAKIPKHEFENFSDLTTFIDITHPDTTVLKKMFRFCNQNKLLSLENIKTTYPVFDELAIAFQKRKKDSSIVTPTVVVAIGINPEIVDGDSPSTNHYRIVTIATIMRLNNCKWEFHKNCKD
ncbi:hypothetical protein Bca52824_017146 [Brassica carinata]|uniref:Copine C-terminal domain-containing protein n=1 Tax=Brassica carinata TaxID=52824 RepID=A0A8X7VM31_BRACI|nr:hypothetical protein Bca52824_017146 [Brassica carinata]